MDATQQSSDHQEAESFDRSAASMNEGDKGASAGVNDGLPNAPYGVVNPGGRSGGVMTGGGVLHVAAVATHCERYMPLLVQSAARLGVKLDVLGWGERLDGFAFRLKKTLDYVETLPPNDVVLFIDAFDVVLLQDAEVIMKKFLSANCSMIVSRDGDHPNVLIDFFIKRVFRPVGTTYINIGAYISFAGFAADLMKALFRFGSGFTENENDQELLARYLSENKGLLNQQILIDEHSDLFLTLYGGHPFWIGKNEYNLHDNRKSLEISKDGAVHYLPTDSWPCVMHFPANGNGDTVLDALNLKLPESVDKNYSAISHSRYLLRMFRHYWKFIWAIFLKIIAVVLCLVFAGYIFYCWRRAASNPATAAANQIRVVPYQPMTQQIATELPRAFLIHSPAIAPSIGSIANTIQVQS